MRNMINCVSNIEKIKINRELFKMNQERLILNKFQDFTRVASPMLYLRDREAYEDSLLMIEHLMESVGEDGARPENLLILLLQNAIYEYESKNEDILAFENLVQKANSDIAVLRILIDQYQLNLDDFPEIGHKTLLCKILSGERALTKNHIIKLCKRFDLNPGLFFN